MGLRPPGAPAMAGARTVTFSLSSTTATFSLKTGRISKVGLKISLCYVLYSVLVGNTEKTLYRTRRERRMADVTRDRKTRGQEGYAPGAPAINYRDNGGLTVTQYGRNEFPHTILMHGSRPPKAHLSPTRSWFLENPERAKQNETIRQTTPQEQPNVGRSQIFVGASTGSHPCRMIVFALS